MIVPHHDQGKWIVAGVTMWKVTTITGSLVSRPSYPIPQRIWNGDRWNICGPIDFTFDTQEQVWAYIRANSETLEA